MGKSKSVLKTGLFGGTFAPPHLGHLHAAKTFLREMDLDSLIIMPTFLPHRKEESPGYTPDIRYRMCKAAFGDLPRTEVSDYEIKKKELSYTVETLEYLHSTAEREILFLCGSDMFMSLGRWRRAGDIFALCRVVCMPRYNDSLAEILRQKETYKKDFGKDAILLSENPFVLSSSEIREKIRTGNDLSEFLSQDVIEIIKNEGLYL